MPKINPYFADLKREYIFPIIEKKIQSLHSSPTLPSIINLGIGDIALPISSTIIQAIVKASQEMQESASFKGYGPSEGYFFLRDAIAQNEFAHLGISADEIFISDGANEDTANILDLFDSSNSIGIADPTYPVYMDASILSGRGDNILLLPCTESTGFLPVPPDQHCDLVYLCSPSNPTGAAMDRSRMQEWVQWAQKENCILLIDSAYTAFVNTPNTPKSIFEIEGAKETAIEFRSFSKSAGFTGLRCAYTILPKTVKAHLDNNSVTMHSLWRTRQGIKTNGVSYPIQRGAEAVFSPEGRRETKSQIASYLEQAKILRQGLSALGHLCWGGTDSPYIWWKTPSHMTSWEFFDLLLEKCRIICVPGTGFGKNGEGYVRLSAFTTGSQALEALTRIKTNI